jgi:hypothetical protein
VQQFLEVFKEPPPLGSGSSNIPESENHHCLTPVQNFGKIFRNKESVGSKVFEEHLKNQWFS